MISHYIFPGHARSVWEASPELQASCLRSSGQRAPSIPLSSRSGTDRPTDRPRTMCNPSWQLKNCIVLTDPLQSSDESGPSMFTCDGYHPDEAKEKLEDIQATPILLPSCAPTHPRLSGVGGGGEGRQEEATRMLFLATHTRRMDQTVSVTDLGELKTEGAWNDQVPVTYAWQIGVDVFHCLLTHSSNLKLFSLIAMVMELSIEVW